MSLNYLISEFGLQRINTFTKYPSILTYHDLGDKGTLVNSLVEGKDFSNKDHVYITEKINGTNSRVVAITDSYGVVRDYIIGSREDLLYAFQDRIINTTLGIVNTVNPFADRLVNCAEKRLEPDSIYCIYGETFGGAINGGKQYTSKRTYGFRLFDFWTMPLNSAVDVLSLKIDAISSWREHGGQPYKPVHALLDFCNGFCDHVPYLKQCSGDEIPTDMPQVYEWLSQFAQTKAVLDEDYQGDGRAEGVVVRTENRDLIRKLRFEEYEKTKKRGLF